VVSLLWYGLRIGAAPVRCKSWRFLSLSDPRPGRRRPARWRAVARL